jgi:hypothetical protein
MASPGYVDYTAGRRVEYTGHARYRMEERNVADDDVWWVLAHHERDVEGDQPWKREVTGSVGGRTILVVIVPLADTVRVITVIG